MSASTGPAACVILAVCYWAGKEFEVDFFNYGQKLYAGTPIAPFKRAIDDRPFGAIMMNRRSLAGENGPGLPPSILAAIKDSYRDGVPGTEDYVILSPADAP